MSGPFLVVSVGGAGARSVVSGIHGAFTERHDGALHLVEVHEQTVSKAQGL